MEGVFINSEIIELPIEQIKPYEGSHNVESVIDMIAESITKYGIQQPITIDENNVVITGNAIFKALVKLGYKTAPCSYAKHLSQDEVAQYRIADNKTSEFATWNEKKLKKEISCIRDANNMQFAFDENLMSMIGVEEKIMKSITPTIVAQPQEKITPTTPAVQEERDRIKEEIAEKDKKFNESLQRTEVSIVPKSSEYLEYVCSKCKRKVIVRI